MKGLSAWRAEVDEAGVESLFAPADAVERAVEVARRRAEKVDHAILARAFRGEL